MLAVFGDFKAVDFRLAERSFVNYFKVGWEFASSGQARAPERVTADNAQPFRKGNLGKQNAVGKRVGVNRFKGRRENYLL